MITSENRMEKINHFIGQCQGERGGGKKLEVVVSGKNMKYKIILNK